MVRRVLVKRSNIHDYVYWVFSHKKYWLFGKTVERKWMYIYNLKKKKWENWPMNFSPPRAYVECSLQLSRTLDKIRLEYYKKYVGA